MSSSPPQPIATVPAATKTLTNAAGKYVIAFCRIKDPSTSLLSPLPPHLVNRTVNNSQLLSSRRSGRPDVAI